MKVEIDFDEIKEWHRSIERVIHEEITGAVSRKVKHMLSQRDSELSVAIEKYAKEQATKLESLMTKELR